MRKELSIGTQILITGSLLVDTILGAGCAVTKRTQEKAGLADQITPALVSDSPPDSESEIDALVETAAPSLTPTIEMTATLEPTKVDVPEGAVETANGNSLFVEQGKTYVVDVTTGVTRETELSKEIFANVFDASDLVKQLHPELFEGDQQPLLDFLLPPETVKDGKYDYSLLHTRMAYGNQVQGFEVVGSPIEFITVGFPEGHSFNSAYIMMMAVYGIDEPVPITIGIRENGSSDAVMIMDGSVEFNLFQNRSGKPNLVSQFESVNDLKKDLLGQRISFGLVLGVPNSTEEYLKLSYDALPEHNLIAAVKKYYVERYGLAAYEVRNVDRKNGGKAGGSLFIPALELFRDDEALRDGFMGFLPSMRQAVKYLPQ